MGKHKYIETPERMWELFLAYVTDTKTNPRVKIEYVGKDGDRVDTPIERPLTIEGFKNWCAEDYGTIQHYLHNSEGAYDDYRTIMTRVREVIRQDQIEGGMIGQFNSNLTARINALSDKSEVNTNTSIKLLNIDPIGDNRNDSPTEDSGTD